MATVFDGICGVNRCLMDATDSAAVNAEDCPPILVELKLVMPCRQNFECNSKRTEGASVDPVTTIS